MPGGFAADVSRKTEATAHMTGADLHFRGPRALVEAAQLYIGVHLAKMTSGRWPSVKTPAFQKKSGQFLTNSWDIYEGVYTNAHNIEYNVQR